MVEVLYIIIALVVALWLYVSNRKNRKGNQIPGPRGLPFIGMGFWVTSESLHIKLEEFAGKYGDIAQIKMFGDTLVSINTAELLRKAFNEDPFSRIMNDRHYSFWATRILEDSQSIGFYPQAFGGKRGDMRKGMTRALHVYGDGMKQFEERIIRELHRLDNVFIEKEGKDFDLISVIKRSLTNLTGEELGDDDIDADLFWKYDHPNEVMLNAKTNAILSAFPFIVKLPGYYKTLYNDALDAKQKILERYFYKVRETHQRGQVRGVVDFLLDEQAKETETGGEVVWTDIRIKNSILELTAAEPTFGLNVRLYLGLNAIIPNVWQIQHNKDVWGDPWTFRPERWLDESGQLLPASHPLRKHWLVFGTGRRQCSGEQFGRNRLFLYLASLLKSYKFTGTPGKYGSCDPREGFFLVTGLLRSNPYLCKAEKRV